MAAHRRPARAPARGLRAAVRPEQLPPVPVPQVYIYAIAILGLNMLTGYNGQFSLGHGAFYAVGAYVSAIMMDRWNVPYGWTIPVAGVLCLWWASSSGCPRSGWKGLYLALATFSLALAVPADPQVLRALDRRLAGHRADQAQRPVRPLAELRPVALLRDPGRAGGAVLARRQSPAGTVGRAIVAIRDNHIAAEAMGDQQLRSTSRWSSA